MAVLMLKLAVDVCWYLAVMLPILSVLPLPVAVLGYAAAVIYVGIQLWKRRAFLCGEENKEIFLWQCYILLFAAIVECLLMGPKHWEQMSGMMSLVFFALSILHMRIARTGANYQKDARFWMLNISYLAMFFIVILVLTSKTIGGKLMWLAGNIYLWVILPVVWAVISAFGWGIDLIVQAVVKIFPEQKEKLINIYDLLFSQKDTLVEQMQSEGTFQFPDISKYIGIVLLCIAVLVVLWRIYLKLIDAASKGGVSGASMEKEKISKKDRKTFRKRLLQNEEKSVRLFYLKFLKLCQKEKILITPCDSSREIQKKAEVLWMAEAQKPLRDIYIKARYSGKRVSKKDVDRAEEEFKKLKYTKKDSSISFDSMIK